MIDKQPSCDDEQEPELLPVEEARRRLMDVLRPVTGTERVALKRSAGRVLAVPVSSPLDVPAQANSAMDGFALSALSIPASGTASLAVPGTAWAGKPFAGEVKTGQAVRIFTGAILPVGTDTVVIQEHVEAGEGVVTIDETVVPGRNVRAAGEDVQRGQEVLPAGRCLSAADVGVIASLGIDTVLVHRVLNVAYFTTGDELRSLDEFAGTELPPGTLFDSNAYTLRVLLEAHNVNIIDLGIVRDTAEDTRSALTRAADEADIIITSGGVSAGEADFVTRVFHEMGEVSFWKLAMRPGRPLAFGRVGDAHFFGLPGNPVAVVVTFLQFVQPALRRLAGWSDVETISLPARSLSRLRKSAGRVEFQRGIMSLDEQGQLVVASTGMQGAGRLTSVSAANCLIVIAAEQAGVSPGDMVAVQPFHGLLPG